MSIEDLGLREFRKLLEEKNNEVIFFQNTKSEETAKKSLYFPQKKLKDNTLMLKKNLKHFAKFGR